LSKSFFEQLSTQKSEIEREMEQSLNWFSEDSHKQSRISISKPENFFSSPEKWIEDFVWIRETLTKFDKVFRERIAALK